MTFKGKVKELEQKLDSIEVDDAKEHHINQVLAIMDGSNNPMQEDAAFKELFPKTQIEESLFVVDRDRLSSCGGITACD